MNVWKKTEDPILGETYYTLTHKSGLTLFVLPKQRTATYVNLTAKFGSLSTAFSTENGETTVLPDGVAHFLEHKMFEGKDGIDAFERYAETGANANAFTTFDRTCYVFSCTDAFEENLKILLTYATHPHFTKRNIKKEQGIIGEEIDMYLDNPSWIVNNALMNALYQSHPVRNSIVGSRESISRITPELLYRCTDTFYAPSNMGLFICGNVLPADVERICDELLPEARKQSSVFQPTVTEPEGVCTPLIEQYASVSQPMVELGFKLKPAETAEQAMRYSVAYTVLNWLLFGRSSDFYNRLYEKGLVSAKFYSGAGILPGAFYLCVSAITEDPFALQNEIVSELTDRREHFFTEEECNVAKRVSYANSLFDLESVEDTADTFSALWVQGTDCRAFSELATRITREELWAIFRETLEPSRHALSILYPNERKEN